MMKVEVNIEANTTPMPYEIHSVQTSYANKFRRKLYGKLSGEKTVYSQSWKVELPVFQDISTPHERPLKRGDIPRETRNYHGDTREICMH